MCTIERNSNVGETEQASPGFKLPVISKLPFGSLDIVGDGVQCYQKVP